MSTNIRKDSSSSHSNNLSKKQSKTLVVPIDLPGQPIQCWIGDAEKIQVILRKSRDVIFDIHLFNGKSYSVRAEMSDMYDTRTKKLIHPREEIFFQDGEILHLQIGRNFKGKILLFESKKQLGAYSISQLDPIIESLDPTFKPAPISIIIKSDQFFVEKPFSVMQLDGSITTPTYNDCEAESFLQIVEINVSEKDVPHEIADIFKKGGEKEIVTSGGVLTRNWIMNQVVAQSGYASDNVHWMKELWKDKIILKSIEHKNSGRKMYVILTGSTRVRRLLKASRYGVINTKVLAFSYGAGTANGLRHASWTAAKGNFRRGGLAALLFTITLDIAEWTEDYEQRDPVTGKPKQDISDLFTKIGIDISKNVVNSVISSSLIWMALTFLGGAPLIAIIIGTVAITVLVGWNVDFLDKKFGVTEKALKAMKESSSKLENKLKKDYEGYSSAVTQAFINGGVL
ncbi:hypothetical protein SAMN05192549_103469 [Duganella sacchari]|uniref:Uncharacterized protein n=1 Tax=Duganella sacchari TaxID=551987 RepID=A0A1M7N4B3_9BURK|nr:hypothetical protein [Duganella sacchari]SHM98431.1 hypothetical protein SAMN05192549_103469 [Duganella sacchari]